MDTYKGAGVELCTQVGNMNRNSMPMVDRGQMVHVKLPRQLYERMRYYLMGQGFPRGGMTGFIVEAVDRHLGTQEQRPLTFEEAFRGQWKMSPTALDKWRCYGALIDKEKNGVLVRQVGRFTIPELQRHHDTSQWDERTYVLVDEQIKRHHASGVEWNEQRPLIPPVPTAVIDEGVPPPATPGTSLWTPSQPTDFDPQKACFLAQGGCPQPSACVEAGGCCAEAEEGL